MPGTPTSSRSACLPPPRGAGRNHADRPPGEPAIPGRQLGVQRRRCFRCHPPQRAGEAARPDPPVPRPHRSRSGHGLVSDFCGGISKKQMNNGHQESFQRLSDCLWLRRWKGTVPRVPQSHGRSILILPQIFLWRVPENFTLHPDVPPDDIQDIDPVGKLSGHPR